MLSCDCYYCIDTLLGYQNNQSFYMDSSVVDKYAYIYINIYNYGR